LKNQKFLLLQKNKIHIGTDEYSIRKQETTDSWR